MTSLVHPLWLEFFDNAITFRRARPSRSIQLSLELWMGLGRVIGVEERTLRWDEAKRVRPKESGLGVQGCAWYKCTLNIIPNLVGPRERIMRCVGCHAVSSSPPPSLSLAFMLQIFLRFYTAVYNVKSGTPYSMNVVPRLMNIIVIGRKEDTRLGARPPCVSEL